SIETASHHVNAPSLHDALPIFTPPLQLRSLPLRRAQQQHATGDVPTNDRRRKRDLIAIVQSDEAVGRTGDCRRRAADQFSLFEADRKSTRLNSSHLGISYAVFC